VFVESRVSRSSLFFSLFQAQKKKKAWSWLGVAARPSLVREKGFRVQYR